MNNSRKTFAAGWVKDAHGLKGELYIQLFAKKADWLDSFTEFWLKTDQGEQLFEVDRASRHKDGLIIKAPSIHDRTQAESYKRATFLIPEEYLHAKPGEGIFLHQILGFKVVDGEVELGVIESFSTNGAQDLLNVRTPDREMLIPFIEAFIKKIDFDNRVVFMELPQGL